MIQRLNQNFSKCCEPRAQKSQLSPDQWELTAEGGMEQDVGCILQCDLGHVAWGEGGYDEQKELQQEHSDPVIIVEGCLQEAT